MTKTTKTIKVRGLRDSRKLFWDYKILQWLAYVNNWDREELHKDVKARLPEDKESRNRLMLSWWVANRTYQDTLKFNFLVYFEPGFGHYVVAELVECGPQFGDPMFTHWTPYSGGWEPWDERASSTKSFVGGFKTLEEAENEAWCLDEAYFREDEDEDE